MSKSRFVGRTAQINQAEQLHAATPEPKPLHIFDRGGHNDIFFLVLAAFLKRVIAFCLVDIALGIFR
jgi:hypothetical protein